MKWYLNLIIFILGGILFVSYIRSGSGFDTPDLITDLIFGSILGSVAFGGYYEGQKWNEKRKMSPDQLKAAEVAEKKSNRILRHLIIGFIIVCIILVVAAIAARMFFV